MHNGLKGCSEQWQRGDEESRRSVLVVQLSTLDYVFFGLDGRDDQ